MYESWASCCPTYPSIFKAFPILPNPSEIWGTNLGDLSTRNCVPMPRFAASEFGAPRRRFAAMVRGARAAGNAVGRKVLSRSLSRPRIWQKLRVVAGVYKSRRKEKAKEREAACIALCKNLKIEPYLKNDDDIDAIICAVTAVASEEYLCKSRDYKIESERLPCGYRLLKRNPFERIYVDEEDFSKWMSGHEKHA